MAKFLKVLLIIAAAIFGVGILASVVLALFFDPNDYRGQIERMAYQQTGRELSIDGDIDLKVFPWLALEVGSTSFGNAEGFGSEPMVRFERARLSVEFLPLVMEQQIRVGTASLEGLVANLGVLGDGRTNWDDIGPVDPDEVPETVEDEEAAASEEMSLDIASVVLSDARIVYDDAAAGSRYELSDVNIETGAIAIDQPFDVDGALNFVAAPNDMSGTVDIDGRVTVNDDFSVIDVADLAVRGNVDGLLEQPTELGLNARAITLDSEGQVVELGEIDLNALGMNVSANVEPISYAGEPTVVATLRVAEFSLKELLDSLDIEAPETADPNALEKVSFEARAAADADALALTDLRLVLDDTTLSGSLAVPVAEGRPLTFDLTGDSITVDNYMAPAFEGDTVDEEAADVEIPAELIRTLFADGTLRFDEAFLGPVHFTAMQVRVTAADGRMRLHPIEASFFEGKYSGDVRIDATGSAPKLSVNETIENVSIAPMLAAMYDVQDVSGTINAGFELTGAGQTLSTMTGDLDGNLAFELMDGQWNGVDVWHQLRSARALFKREPAPEPRNPPRTEFTSITLAGPVTDGVFTTDNLLAELPFLRITGGGTVGLVEREVDYSVQARVLENPEFANVASDDELKDFTQALIPIRIRGPLASPSFRPDIEGIFRQEVERAIDQKKEELKQDLLDRLLGGDEGEAGEGADTESPENQAVEEEKDLEDRVKDRLKDLFPR